MRFTDRTAYDPAQPDIDGLSSNPSLHTTGTVLTIDELAEGAVEDALSVDIPPQALAIGQHVMRIEDERQAASEGVELGEDRVNSERELHIEAALRDIGPGSTPSPATVHDPKLEKISKKIDPEIATRKATILAMETRIAQLAATRGLMPKTAEEIHLIEQAGLSKSRIQALELEKHKIEESMKPSSDPLTRRKLQQERDRMRGDLPGIDDAILWQLKQFGIDTSLGPTEVLKQLATVTVASPRMIADMIREIKRVRDNQGQSKKQSRREDRARRRRGEAPVHELQTSKAEKRRNERNSYNRIARTGNVLAINDPTSGDDELYVVYGIEPVQAVFTDPVTGGSVELVYDNGTPVYMDDVRALNLSNPGSSPTIYAIDPTTGSKKELDTRSADVLKLIHKGEEWVTLGQLYTPEEAKETYIDGAEGYSLSPLKVRLDDLVFGLYGDPDQRAIELTEKEREEALRTHLVWQSTLPSSSVRVSGPHPSVGVFDGQNGHFVKPFTYAEHRRDTYINEILRSRRIASSGARAGEVKPPKGIDDPNKPFYRGPRRRR